jgi:hypothetical protein
VVNVATATQVAAIAKAIVFAVTPARPRPRAPSFRGNSVACAVTGAALGAAFATAVVSGAAVIATPAPATAVVNLALALTVAIEIAIVLRPRAPSFRRGSAASLVTVAALGAAFATAVGSGVAATAATTSAATAVRLLAAIDPPAQARGINQVGESRDGLDYIGQILFHFIDAIRNRWYYCFACGAVGGGTVGRTLGQNRWRCTTVTIRTVATTRCRADAAATAAASAAVTPSLLIGVVEVVVDVAVADDGGGAAAIVCTGRARTRLCCCCSCVCCCSSRWWCCCW